MASSASKKKAASSDHASGLALLQARFERFASRHPDIAWREVEERLQSRPEKLAALLAMEETGGEPDVIGRVSATSELRFVDCSPETPRGRVSVCYDRAGWESRKEHRPKNTALDLAREMGVELLSEEDYLALQTLGAFDQRTSSWLLTPPEIRQLGGALYGERRYGRVFIGSNGAQSYYAVRGFRASLKV